MSLQTHVSTTPKSWKHTSAAIGKEGEDLHFASRRFPSHNVWSTEILVNENRLFKSFFLKLRKTQECHLKIMKRKVTRSLIAVLDMKKWQTHTNGAKKPQPPNSFEKRARQWSQQLDFACSRLHRKSWLLNERSNSDPTSRVYLHCNLQTRLDKSWQNLRALNTNNNVTFFLKLQLQKILKKSKNSNRFPMQKAGLPTLGVAWDSVALERTSEGHQECPFAPWPSQTPSPSHTIQHRRRQTPQWKELCVPTWELGLDYDVHISYPKKLPYAIMDVLGAIDFTCIFCDWPGSCDGEALSCQHTLLAPLHPTCQCLIRFPLPQAGSMRSKYFPMLSMLSPAATVVSVFAFVRQYDNLLLLLCDVQTFSFFHWMIIQPMGCSGKDCNKPPRKMPCLSKGCLLPATILEVQATLAMGTQERPYVARKDPVKLRRQKNAKECWTQCKCTRTGTAKIRFYWKKQYKILR